MLYLSLTYWLTEVPIFWAVKNKNNPWKRGMHKNEMRHSNVPKWLNTDKPQRQKQCLGSSQPRFTNSCAVPSRGDWGNSKRHRTVRRLCRCHLHFCMCAFSVLDSERGNICPKHMHTHGSSPGEKKATYDCWFHSPRRTKPSLILFEGGKCDATKTGASTSSADPSKESGKGKLVERFGMCECCGAVKNITFKSASCWGSLLCPSPF